MVWWQCFITAQLNWANEERASILNALLAKQLDTLRLTTIIMLRLTQKVKKMKYEIYHYYEGFVIGKYQSWVSARDALKKIQWPATMYAIREV